MRPRHVSWRSRPGRLLGSAEVRCGGPSVQRNLSDGAMPVPAVLPKRADVWTCGQESLGTRLTMRSLATMDCLSRIRRWPRRDSTTPTSHSRCLRVGHAPTRMKDLSSSCRSGSATCPCSSAHARGAIRNTHVRQPGACAPCGTWLLPRPGRTRQAGKSQRASAALPTTAPH